MTTTTEPTWKQSHSDDLPVEGQTDRSHRKAPGIFGCPYCLNERYEREAEATAFAAEIADDIENAEAFEEWSHGEVTFGTSGKCRMY